MECRKGLCLREKAGFDITTIEMEVKCCVENILCWVPLSFKNEFQKKACHLAVCQIILGCDKAV